MSADASVILVHDAARPFVTADVIDRAIDGALAASAVVPAVPVHDTVKQVAPGDTRVVAHAAARETLFLAQTPQAFPARRARRGHRRRASEPAPPAPTRRCSPEAGRPRGPAGRRRRRNVKITTAADHWSGPGRSVRSGFAAGARARHRLHDLHVFAEAGR